jgi:hypothetical protein
MKAVVMISLIRDPNIMDPQAYGHGNGIAYPISCKRSKEQKIREVR